MCFNMHSENDSTYLTSLPFDLPSLKDCCILLYTIN